MKSAIDAQSGPSSIRVTARTAADRQSIASREWLLTDRAGGYAMGSAALLPTRRYHGLLTVALLPPVERRVLLHSTQDIVTLHPGTPDERVIDLASAAFTDGTRLRGGSEHLEQFDFAGDARWTYDLGGGALLHKTLVLHELRGAASLRYELEGAEGHIEIRPLLAMRDHHHLNAHADDSFRVGAAACGVSATIRRGELEMTLDARGNGARFEERPHWWHGFHYEIEHARGYDSSESLFCPGSFRSDLAGPALLVARLGGHAEDRDLLEWSDDHSAEKDARLTQSFEHAMGHAPAGDPDAPMIRSLVRAADQFVVRRALTPGAVSDEHSDVSIIAGYPWFADWGRDAMIAMPGLLLTTGRTDEAIELLSTFARAVDAGMVPNRFSDDDGSPEYNTVDASLWFIHAVCRCAQIARDAGAIERIHDELIPACLDVVQGYTHGTRYGIRVDPADGLVAAGDHTTQLTWMDAQRDGEVFTPRFGKPVEIQALWQSSLRSLAHLVERTESRTSRELTAKADQAADAIRERFWCEREGCAYDRLEPSAGGWRPVLEIRPNQLFLVSLPHCPISRMRARSLVMLCRDRLLTPMGVRTLDPLHGDYRGRFTGSIRDLDAAYHNGTVWPWLTGPLAEAWILAHDASPEACADARSMIQPLITEMMNPESPSLGQLYEVYDGDFAPKPQTPGGCPAQAWSVAEMLRVISLVRGCESAKA